MAKKKKAVKKKTVTHIPAETPKDMKVSFEESLRGRYANHIALVVQEEDFVLDFFARTAGSVAFLNRVFITPQHAKRLQDLLRNGLSNHKKQFGVKRKG